MGVSGNTPCALFGASPESTGQGQPADAHVVRSGFDERVGQHITPHVLPYVRAPCAFALHLSLWGSDIIYGYGRAGSRAAA